MSKEILYTLFDCVGHKIDASQVERYQEILTEEDIRLLEQDPDLKRLCWGNKLFISRELLDALEDYLTSQEQIAREDIRELGIDIETYSGEDLTKCGVYRYAEAPDFEVLLFAYSVNGGRVRIADLASGEQLPDAIREALTDPNVLKTAYNAAFERICLSRMLGMPSGEYLPAEQWDCTMVRAARLGMPLSLDECGNVLGIERTKMKEGRALIRYFSVPCKPTKANGGRTRNLPVHAPERWATFKRYCKRDVEAEQEIRQRVINKPVIDRERQMWLVDQRINDRGVMIDRRLAESAVRMDAEAKETLKEEAKRITGLDNPNSVTALKTWIHDKEGMSLASLGKAGLPELIDKCRSSEVKTMLRIRQELGKTSTNKYEAMLRCVCRDGRIRGLFQFYGANRTGRWAGRLVQMQNLPQNHLTNLDSARRALKAGDLEEIEMMHGNATQVLSELIRTAFIAKPGHIFHVCDFSAIECRVLAWMAGEEWVLDVFRKGGDIYCSTASQMFHVPVEKHGQNAHLRQKGKIATLACGYGGGWRALEAMGGSRMGLSQAEEEEIIKMWRLANPNIVRLWTTIERAAVYCVKNRTEAEIQPAKLKFAYRWGGLQVTLPSGRSIYYPRMHMGEEKGHEALIYEGVDQTTKKWGEIYTYGGKMTENIIQATARDCLAEVMLRLEERGIQTVFHVHDEVICECPPGQTLQMIEDVFADTADWEKGLPLKGAGYTTPYYLKD